MFILKKVLTPFLLPPGIFILSLLVLGIWLLFKKRRVGIVNIVIGCLMWVFTISPVSNAMFGGLESDFDLPRDIKGDVIILLGGGVYERVPGLTGMGAPSEGTIRGIIAAIRLRKSLNVPIIVSGGKVFEHMRAEAPIIRRFLMDLGVPAADIITEGRSRDTFENAKYTREICLGLGYKNPILITPAFRMKRSILAFEDAGLRVVPFPSYFNWRQNGHFEWNNYLPGSFSGVRVTSHEYLGLLFYKFAY